MPSGAYIFDTQEKIDDLLQFYPNCVSLDDEVIIGDEDFNTWNSDIDNVLGFKNIKEISGNLLISGNQKLRTLEGMDSLQRVGGELWVSNNGLFTSRHIAGATDVTWQRWIGNGKLSDLRFPSRDSIDFLYISGNNKDGAVWQDLDISELKKVDRLEIWGQSTSFSLVLGDGSINYLDIYGCKFTSIKKAGDEIGKLNILSIGNCYWLEKFPAFENLKNLGFLQLYELPVQDLSEFANLRELGIGFNLSNNDSLKDLSGLDSLAMIPRFAALIDNDNLVSISQLEKSILKTEEVLVTGNVLLKECDILCPRLMNDTLKTVIDDNNDGCKNKEDIKNQCLLGAKDHVDDIPLLNYTMGTLIFRNKEKFKDAEFIVSDNLGRTLMRATVDKVNWPYDLPSIGVNIITIKSQQNVFGQKIFNGL